jgi:uncharacterized protein (DUF486 family)
VLLARGYDATVTSPLLPVDACAARPLNRIRLRPPGESPPMPILSPFLTPVILLIGSNVFMTTAWYWHLRYKEVPLISVIFISWGLAFVEYCMAVPANRYGSAVYTTAQLKTMQEVITFAVFAVFSFFYLREPITLSQGFGFALIAAGAFFVFHKW